MIPYPTINFELPAHLACPLPTEQRHIQRDEVRLLVSNGSGDLFHDHFSQLDHYLKPGDVLVVNTSATLPAAIPIHLADDSPAMLHLSTQFSETSWLVEIRAIKDTQTIRWKGGKAGMRVDLPGGGHIELVSPFYNNKQWIHLWKAEFHLDRPITSYLDIHGHPIKYTQLDNPFPLSYYQTYFSEHPGSSEMPSAGRGFTSSLVRKLLRKGLRFAPILLHTGISSLEQGELPYPEYMEISALSANIIQEAKSTGNRIIAVGTTAIRALETASHVQGEIQAFRGMTEVYIHESYHMKIADGLLTGFHEPQASHLNMLLSIAGMQHIDQAYRAAIQAQYFWHQFGDLHLILS
ncbi:MAG: S-adenosylmethionine:tRNA ribosyltransferase-isomerase [Bacteroidota bacterium]